MPASLAGRRLCQWAFRTLSGHDHPASIHADGPETLRRRLSLVDDRVPPRRRRTPRHQDHKEWHCLCRYLVPLAERLDYPLTVRKSQSPDFLIEHPDGSRTGLEVREATTQAYQRELTRTEGQPGPHLIDANGWAGDAVERGIAALVTEGVADKARKIAAQNKWQQAARHDLLFYSNGPYIAPNVSRLAMLLVRELCRHPELSAGGDGWPNGPIGMISVLIGEQLLFDVTGERAVLRIDPVSA